MTLHELIERQAKSRPRAPALILKKEIVTYLDLQDRIERWASALRDRGVKSGDNFGIVMRNSVEFVVTFFALARLGARAVPVNFQCKADEISFIFGDAGVVGVITQPPFLAAVLEARKKLPKLRDVIVSGDDRHVHQALSYRHLMDTAERVPDLPRATDSHAIAMLIYTSGTTGSPKGTPLTHRNLIANAEQCCGMVKLSRRDIFLCLLPMFHSFSWTVCVVLPLFLGGSTVIIESIQPFDNVIKNVLRRRVSIFVAVPPIYSALLRVPFWWPLRLINPIRFCISGAAALPPAVHHKFEKKFGIPLMEGYGLTEASPVVTLNPQEKRITGSIGRALPGIGLKIVGTDDKEVSAGEVGELCVRGENVMKGYYHQEEANREAFLDSSRHWLRTGDLGYMDAEGYVYISDRKKDLIIVKGLNVYPREVEDVLLTHPAVADAAVIGIPDETGDELIRAFVTLKEGHNVDKAVLLKLCRGRLASYKCPRDLEIRKELPKNAIGKVLKRALRSELR
jgi:long-chain acyl-CoA synthetase